MSTWNLIWNIMAIIGMCCSVMTVIFIVLGLITMYRHNCRKDESDD